MKLIYQSGLVFYDLEWTGPELLQIGAVCGDRVFDRTILTQADIHFKVREKIFLETRQDGDGRRQVYDCKSEKFLSSTSMLTALTDFLDWIQEIYFRHGQVILISHGNIDVPILVHSYGQFDLDELFLERITTFLNFQDYLKTYFPGMPLSLSELGINKNSHFALLYRIN